MTIGVPKMTQFRRRFVMLVLDERNRLNDPDSKYGPRVPGILLEGR